MMRIFFSLIFCISFASAFSQTTQPRVVPMMDFGRFEPYLHRQTDTLYLVNFWATWCIPCREEMPAIEQIRGKYEHSKFKVILVSLDFPNQLESRLKPFIRDNNIKSEVILLNDPNQNQWIDKVDPSWSGEIPFTIIYKQTSRESFARTFTFSDLDSIINLKINQP